MKILFIHSAFPGQFFRIAEHYAQGRGEVTAIGDKAVVQARPPAAFPARVMTYEIAPNTMQLGPLETAIWSSFARGAVVARCAQQLRSQGYRPDVIFGHYAWGETLYVKDVFPESKLLLYADMFMREHKGTFDDFLLPNQEAAFVNRLQNGPLLMSLDVCDRAVTQTRWQKSTFPEYHHGKIDVIYDGVDTDYICPLGERDDELVTYTAPNLEPVRGFHVFMRAIPEIQRRRPKAKILIVGDDNVRYSPPLPAGTTYRDLALREMAGKIDLSRVSFAKSMPHKEYLEVLRRSTVHVYLTVPHVVSWSLFEAMAAGCLVVGSRTPPVEEIVADRVNGLLVDHPDPAALAAKVAEALERKKELAPIRAAARQAMVEKYDLRRVCLPQQIKLIESLIP